MRGLAGAADFTVEQPDGGRRFKYRWPGLSVPVNEMPAREVPGHLDCFCGFVQHIYGGQPDDRGRQVLDRIRHTRLVAGVVIEPRRDPEGRAEQLLGAMAYGLEALLFFGSALYDKDARLILAPDGTFDEQADVLGPVAELTRQRVQVRLPEREPDQPTPAQEARYRRALAELERRKVPILSCALFIDDAATTLREPAEVARRALALAAVNFRAGADRGRLSSSDG